MRQKILILLFLGTINLLFSQKKETLEFEPLFRFQLFRPIPFGDHSLSKAHSANVGYGLSLDLVQYKNFRIGTGYDFSQYTVTDFTKVGNIKNSNYSSFYGSIRYDIPIHSDFVIQPNIGFGSVNINQKTRKRSFGDQTGTEYRIGFLTDYKLNQSFSVFLGIHYIHSIFNVNTSAEYQNYFGKAQQLQVAIGIKIK